MMGLPNCRQTAFQLSREYAQSNGRERGWGVRVHLFICGACRRYEDYLAWMHRNIPKALGDVQSARLSQAQRARIRQALHEQLQ